MLNIDSFLLTECVTWKKEIKVLYGFYKSFCFVFFVDTFKVLYLFYKSYYVFLFFCRRFPTYDWLETLSTATVK